MATDNTNVTFQEKPTVVTADLSNVNAYFPMVQNNLNKKATIPQIKRDAVATCSTAAAEQNKAATVQNMADFSLISGITVTVQFSETNTASNPKLNINNTGAYEIRLENQAASVVVGSGCWVAGAILEFKYIEVGTNAYWLLVGHDTAQVTSDYTIMADGRIEYSASQMIVEDVYTKTRCIDYLQSKTADSFNITAPKTKSGYRLISYKIELTGSYYTSFLVGTPNYNDDNWWFTVYNNSSYLANVGQAKLTLIWCRD